ncbi:MAG: MFS transporter [Candidatus Limnocylindrales bacterium]
MTHRAELLLLAALGLGAGIVGAELLVTTVALPSIVADLAGWQELRRASWIINGFFVASVAVMPLAGRAGDRFGLVRPLQVAFAVFAVGSLLAGAARSLDWLIAARVVQGLGGGAIVPLATFGASHLFGSHARARALGVVGGLTFLGMAAGPFLGALILQSFDLSGALTTAGLKGSALYGLVVPAWRWIFYLAAPVAVLAGLYVWAAAPAWPEPDREPAAFDVPGALAFSAAFTAGLLALTWLGWPEAPGGGLGSLALGAFALLAAVIGVALERRVAEPFLDPRWFRSGPFVGALLVSGLTGYALATGLVGGAVFVDRVRYGGPDEQRLVLGALALAMAVGAFVSGFLVRHLGPRLVTAAGLLLGASGLALLGSATSATPTANVAALLATFGLGFGLTVTPRSAAAVEALGQRAFGIASGAVTQARFVGMAAGVAILTAFGSNKIEALSVVLTDGAARDAVLPPALQGRPLQDPFVVDALERWAAGEAASILAGIFLVAALVMLAALLPALFLGGRTDRAHVASEGPIEGGAGPAVAREGAPLL